MRYLYAIAALSLILAGPVRAGELPPTAATVSACFAPEDDCAGFAVRSIDQAQHSILANSYNLTTGTGIVEALVKAKARGVDVRLIADKTTPCERNTGIDPLQEAGVPIWIDKHVKIAHAKVFVIDGRVTLAGSFNWSSNASKNSEDLNRLDSEAVAAAYAAHWKARQAVSLVYEGRQDWCRK
jgi:phosphatidylserine/phosphatidylglycerophosphate/cardiolipin synthase-like enzyme